MHRLLLLALLALPLLGLSLAGCGGGGGGTPSQPVRVNFTLPLAGNTTVTQGDAVVLQVTATVTAGATRIREVVFTANGTEIGRVSASPFQLTWNTAGWAPGTYSVIATAYDNANPARSGTATIQITIRSTGVVVTFVAPAVGSRTVEKGATVTLSVTATAPAGIARVQFTANGSLLGTATLPSGGRYSYNWNTSGVAVGSYNIVATAYDKSVPALTGSAGIQIQVNAPAQPVPTVQIDSPSPGATVSWNMSVSVRAQAQATGAKITKIDVTFGGLTRTIAGTGTTSLSGTVAFDTTQVTDGLHDITAIATDTNGRQASATINVTVNNAGSPPKPPF